MFESNILFSKLIIPSVIKPDLTLKENKQQRINNERARNIFLRMSKKSTLKSLFFVNVFRKTAMT